MRYHVTVDDTTFEVEIDAEGVRVDGDLISMVGLEAAGADVYSLLVDGASHTVLAAPSGAGVWNLQFQGQAHRAEVVDDRTKVMREMNSAGSVAKGPEPIRAPMPGLVVKGEVEEGDLVEAGGGLLVVEAMKMENELTATVAGRVGKIHAVTGQTVEKGEVLMDMLLPE